MRRRRVMRVIPIFLRIFLRPRQRSRRRMRFLATIGSWRGGVLGLSDTETAEARRAATGRSTGTSGVTLNAAGALTSWRTGASTTSRRTPFRGGLRRCPKGLLTLKTVHLANNRCVLV